MSLKLKTYALKLSRLKNPWQKLWMIQQYKKLFCFKTDGFLFLFGAESDACVEGVVTLLSPPLV